MLIQNISKNLQRAVSAKGLTLEKLSEITDVPYGTIKNIFYGHCENPTIRTLSAIARALDISIDFLINGIELESKLKKIVRDYQQSDEVGKIIFESIADYIGEARHKDKEPDNSKNKYVYIPVLVPDRDKKKCNIIKLEIPKEILTY